MPRRGLTLIEMLMATAITLLMMAAIVNLFANLGGSIRNRRAIIELSGQLRQVRQRLARDLAGCTVPPGPEGLMPWRQRPGEAIGYFEIIEGNHGDSNPSDLLRDGNADGYPDGIDVTTSIIPSSQILDPDSDWKTDASALGDADDILALTVRSLDVPFVGTYDVPSTDPAVTSDADYPNPDKNQHWMSRSVESNLAEVIWYASETPADNPSTPEDERIFDDPATVQDERLLPATKILEPGMRTIYRKVMLIAPWVTNVRQTPPLPSGLGGLERFRLTNDISVRRDPSGLIMPNTLADLTRREYRCGRGGGSLFPLAFERPRLSDNSKYHVLDDALAFDVRVYDPGAPLLQYGGGANPQSQIILQPGDPEWDPAVKNVTANPIVGFGAYVDLGWDNGGVGGAPAPDYFPPAGAPKPSFQIEHQAGWHPQFGNDPTALTPVPTPNNPYRGSPSVYDTWTWHYENDGVDQYNDGTDIDGDGRKDNMVDLGTNGIDDQIPANTGHYFNGLAQVNGVDDIGERETSPPYPVPLRGVKVILRTYERDARQVREVSVTNSFVP